MGLRKIVLKGDDVLTKNTREILNFDRRLHALLDDMRDTLAEANGVGLAAPQVGVLRRAAIVDIAAPEGEAEILELINPVIISSDGEQEGVEGCLSVPGRAGIVKRPMTVTIEAYDRRGKKYRHTGEGLTARALCHEIDHLDGKLYVDLVTKWVEDEE